MNEQEQKQASLKEKVLQGIRSGEVMMRPRFHFTLKVAALLLVAFAVLIVSVFIFNFILFSIRINSHETFLEFGIEGILVFLAYFPWFLLMLDIALVALLEWMLRRFRFGYTVPVLYLLALLIVLTSVTGAALDRGTHFNEHMLKRSHHFPPPFNAFYEGARRLPKPGSGICRCEVLSIEGNTLVVEDVRNGTTTITIVLPMNDSRATTTNLKVGDIVLIAGREENGVIHAFGVRTITEIRESMYR